MTEAKRTTKKARRGKRLRLPDKVSRVPVKVMAGHKSIEELAKEQGVDLHPWTEEDFKRVREIGKALFRTQEEKDAFFRGIQERRKQSRGS